MGNESILITDFDGTITQYDFYDLVCREFPNILTLGAWEKYEEGTITHFEALRQMFAAIRTDEKKLLDIINDMGIDPEFKSCVKELKNAGWRVIIVSAGCEWYINKLLGDAVADLEIHTNPGSFSPAQGLVLELPGTSPYFSPELGVNKAAVVNDALKKSAQVVYAGDGRPDLPAALMVTAERRFAKHWLARKLKELGEGYRPFNTWSEIAGQLIKEGEK